MEQYKIKLKYTDNDINIDLLKEYNIDYLTGEEYSTLICIKK
jgi:hypothetical protein